MAQRKSVSFVVPCLNEELNVEPTVNGIRAAANHVFDYEIIVVDDGSTDNTLDRMRTLEAQDERVKVLHNPVNLGLEA